MALFFIRILSGGFSLAVIQTSMVLEHQRTNKTLLTIIIGTERGFMGQNKSGFL